MDREIWFEKVGWNYMPCHWKGWAVMAAVVVPAVSLSMLSEWALRSSGYRVAADFVFLIIFGLGYISLWTITKRHS